MFKGYVNTTPGLSVAQWDSSYLVCETLCLLPRTTTGTTQDNQQQQHHYQQQKQTHRLLKWRHDLKRVQPELLGMETAMSEMQTPMDGL